MQKFNLLYILGVGIFVGILSIILGKYIFIP